MAEKCGYSGNPHSPMLKHVYGFSGINSDFPIGIPEILKEVSHKKRHFFFNKMIFIIDNFTFLYITSHHCNSDENHGEKISYASAVNSAYKIVNKAEDKTQQQQKLQ